MRSRYGPILSWGRGWVWRYPGGALFVRIFLRVLQCIPVSRRICRLLTPSTSTRRRISVHCSILRYILLFYQDAALLDRHAHPPHFSTGLSTATADHGNTRTRRRRIGEAEPLRLIIHS